MAKRKGSFTVKTELKDNITKEVLAETTDTGSVDVPVKSSNRSTATIKTSAVMRLSMNYQSVGVDVGVEIPWDVTKETLKEDLLAGFDFAESIVDDKLVERVADAKELLRSMAK